MGKIFWVIVAIGVIFVIVGAIGLATAETDRGVGTDVKFTSSPVQVRFWDNASSAWSEWKNFPFSAGACLVYYETSMVEIRVRPGLEGVRLSVGSPDGQGQSFPLVTTTDDENVISVVGSGRVNVSVLGQGDEYACSLVLVKS